VTPAVIGVITLVAEHPGISQAELARVIGLERATVGATVARALKAGLIRRADAHDDARRYALSLTARGQQMLKALRRRIAAHEALIAGHLTPAERQRLRELLHKLVHGDRACVNL
jgi:DNA-binding MarR family transcriptional regulator